jgi:malonyl-CoA O-methyltransferase
MTPASFSRAAHGYERHAQVQRELAGWLAEWLPRERVGCALELGAGPGVLTRHLAGWAGGVTATDLSPAMVAAGCAAAPWAEWRVAAADVPPAGPWDWIFSSAMLQWTDDPETTFAAWRAALAPGGRVLGALFAAGSLPEWRAVAGDDGPVRWRTPDEWRAALARAGLRVARDEAVERAFTHPSARSFLRSLHGVGAAPARRLGAGTLREMLRGYDARFAAPDGGVQATWVFWRFEAGQC